MANEKNLKRFGKEKPPSSREEAVKNGRKGGKKSAEVRAQAKTSREIVELLDSLPVTENNNGEIMTRLGIPEDMHTRQTLRLLKLMQKAENGDAQANKLLIEIRGEAAASTVNLEIKDEQRAAYDRAAAAIKGAKKK